MSIRFDEQVLVADVDLAVFGVRAFRYEFSDFDYDDVTHIATWTLPQPVGNDRLLLDLDGGRSGVVDTDGARLDGEWFGVQDSFPSGDGVGGGDFRFRLNLLAGDANRDGRVNAVDWFDLRRKLKTTAAAPGTGPAAYSALHDLTGDGAINTPDLLTVRRNLLRSLPAGEPGPIIMAGAPTRRGIPITRGMFGEYPI